MSLRILAVCTGQAHPIKAKSGRTGHFKTPQSGAVEVTKHGLRDDCIVDVKHHGGLEQAVYIFGEEDRLWWEKELSTPTPAGFFGENLLIDDLASAQMCLGDVFEIGDVRLQITAPRIPCVTFAARIGDPKGVKRFHEASRPGAYARVLKTGHIQALDPVVHRPFKGERITVAENMRQYVHGFKDLAFLRRLVTVPVHEQGMALAREKLAQDG